jgi:hypothetical protein
MAAGGVTGNPDVAGSAAQARAVGISSGHNTGVDFSDQIEDKIISYLSKDSGKVTKSDTSSSTGSTKSAKSKAIQGDVSDELLKQVGRIA